MLVHPLCFGRLSNDLIDEEPEDLEEERTIMPSNLGSHPDYTRGYGATISREHAVTIEENRGVVGSSGFLSSKLSNLSILWISLTLAIE